MARRIVFFDGECNLCNTSVDFLIRRDTYSSLQFASLQGETAANMLPEEQRLEPGSIVFWNEGTTTFQSEAILQIVSYLPAPWRWARIFRFLPGSLRDSLYRWVARNRYRWFGKRETCRVPTPEERERFLP